MSLRSGARNEDLQCAVVCCGRQIQVPAGQRGRGVADGITALAARRFTRTACHPAKKSARAGQRSQPGCVQASQSLLIKLKGNRGTSLSTANLSGWLCCGLGPRGRADGSPSSGLPEKIQTARERTQEPLIMLSIRALPCALSPNPQNPAHRCRGWPVWQASRLPRVRKQPEQGTQVPQEAEWPTP